MLVNIPTIASGSQIRDVMINTNYIVSIEEAGVSSAWHGIRSHIIVESGGTKKTYDCPLTVMDVARIIESE